MVKIYKDKRTNRLWALDEMLTMGTKVHMVPLTGKEDKFVSQSTLKRWYSKWDEVNMVVELKAFTGMTLGWFKVTYETDEYLGFWTKGMKHLIFDKKTDTQINPRNPKFANHIGMTLGYPTVF